MDHIRSGHCRPSALASPLYVMFLDLGILATPIPLILTYAVVNLPIVVWLSRDFVARVPYEIEESAIVDGAAVQDFLCDHPSDDHTHCERKDLFVSDPELECSISSALILSGRVRYQTDENAN